MTGNHTSQVPVADTPFGFRWGSAEVVRVTNDARRGWVVIEVRAVRRGRVVRAVQVTVWKGGKMEWREVTLA